MTASFPGSVKSFTTKADNMDDVMAVDINDIQDEVMAIETHLVTNYGVFKPLTTPLTSTSWDGDAYSTTSKTKIDLSSVFGVPAGVKAILAYVQAKDSASSSANCFFSLSPNSSAGSYPFICKPYNRANDTYEGVMGIVPCDSSGDVYYQCTATGSATLDVIIEIWGYWV